MQIYIDNRSSAPIYDQIVSQIKSQVMAGALTPETALPSIRSLAKDLRVSVITTKRAYDELEREGFIYTVAAKGSFVAMQNTARLREENLRRVESLLAQAAKLAADSGIQYEELTAMLSLAAGDKEEQA